MKWTTEPPTEPGWFFVSWKPDWCFADEIVRVRYKWESGRKTDKLVVCPAGTEAQYDLDVAQMWAGPIPEPDEA